MFNYIIDNLATIIISVILLTVVALIVLNMIKKKKSGKSISCGCACDGCPSASLCHKP
ncbi:MAG: FeoB-associated Cys-rich membrane protein [Clostridiaceae bacterium]|nr:FeoB-associated Cys-rich membrane protein [Clostridiaceae bacterium]